MSSLPRQSQNGDKRITNSQDDDFFSWRDSKPDHNLPVRSKGIPPKSFHRNRRQRPGDESVQKLHTTVQQSLLKEEKRKVFQESEIKRSAFKQLTSLRTWPLQNRAFQHWRELMDEYMHDGGKWRAGNYEEMNRNPESQESDSSHKSAGSSSTASSGISFQDPKRVLRDTAQSPAKSKLKNLYRNEFENERNLSAPLSQDHDFGSPLWSMEPRIFSSEKSDTGKRKYVVGHLGRFIDLYWCKVDPQHRFYYELIPENTPCRLYLDLEFSKIANPEISLEDAEELLDELFMEIRHEVADQFGLSHLDRSNVVDLESSTETKFSRHWIVHLPNQQLFAHTVALGHFIQQFTSRLANDQATNALKERGRPMLQRYFLVNAAPSKSESKDSQPKQTCFIDCGVYTRNRLFRIMGSQKFGKPPSAALRIADKNVFRFPDGFSNSLFYLPDMQRKPMEHASANDTSNETSDELENTVKEYVASTDWNKHAEALAQTLVVPLNWAKVTYPILPFDHQILEETGRSKTKVASNSHISRASTSLSVGNKSPYPSIDDFVVTQLAGRGGVQGSIRAWSVMDAPCKGAEDSSTSPAFITYQMSRNKWCECVGRAHRSNNIQWTVDLRLWHCVQSCHDPECRMLGFRGTPVPLPQEIREQVEDQMFEEQLERLDEDSLIERARSTNDVTTSQTLLTALSTLSIAGTSDEKAKIPTHLSSFEQTGEDSFEEQLLRLDVLNSDFDEKPLHLAGFEQSDDDSFEEQLLRLEETVTSQLEKPSSHRNDPEALSPSKHQELITTSSTLPPSLPVITESKPAEERDDDSSDEEFDLVASFISRQKVVRSD